MKITNNDMEQLAFQSRLDLTEEQKSAYAKSLHEILDYLEIVNKLETSNVEPAGHVLPFKNVFREDKREASLEKEQVFANVPEEAGDFIVPGIV